MQTIPGEWLSFLPVSYTHLLLFCLAMALFMLVILYISRSLTAPFQKIDVYKRQFWYILPDGKVVLVRSIYSLNATMHTLGYLLITMDLQQLYAIARQYAFHDSSRLYLLDSDGSLLYGPSGTDDVPPEGLLDLSLIHIFRGAVASAFFISSYLHFLFRHTLSCYFY